MAVVGVFNGGRAPLHFLRRGVVVRPEHEAVVDVDSISAARRVGSLRSRRADIRAPLLAYHETSTDIGTALDRVRDGASRRAPSVAQSLVGFWDGTQEDARSMNSIRSALWRMRSGNGRFSTDGFSCPAGGAGVKTRRSPEVLARKEI